MHQALLCRFRSAVCLSGLKLNESFPTHAQLPYADGLPKRVRPSAERTLNILAPSRRPAICNSGLVSLADFEASYENTLQDIGTSWQSVVYEVTAGSAHLQSSDQQCFTLGSPPNTKSAHHRCLVVHAMFPECHPTCIDP